MPSVSGRTRREPPKKTGVGKDGYYQYIRTLLVDHTVSKNEEIRSRIPPDLRQAAQEKLEGVREIFMSIRYSPMEYTRYMGLCNAVGLKAISQDDFLRPESRNNALVKLGQRIDYLQKLLLEPRVEFPEGYKPLQLLQAERKKLLNNPRTKVMAAAANNPDLVNVLNLLERVPNGQVQEDKGRGVAALIGRLANAKLPEPRQPSDNVENQSPSVTPNIPNPSEYGPVPATDPQKPSPIVETTKPLGFDPQNLPQEAQNLLERLQETIRSLPQARRGKFGTPPDRSDIESRIPTRSL